MTMADGATRGRTHRRHRHRSYVYLPFAYRVRRQTLYRFLLVGFLLIAAVILLPFALYHYLSDEPHIEEGLSEAEAITDDAIDAAASSLSLPDAAGSGSERPSPREATGANRPAAEAPEAGRTAGAATETTLQSILETYRSATGLRDVQSLLLHGEYVEDGRRFEMKLAAKAPDLVRKTLNDDKLSMVCSYDGKVATVHVEQGPGQSASQTLDDVLYQKAIVLEGAFLSLAGTGPDLPGPRHSRRPDQSYEDRDCWTITSRLPGATRIHHLIDPETGYERARYLEVTLEGTRHQISMHFTDYRASGGHTLPHTYNLKVNGTPRGTARIDSVQSNQGLMPWMFSMDVP